MNELIRKDLFRVYPKKASFIALLKALKIPGFCYMFFFRKASLAASKSPARLFYRVMLRHYSYKFGFQIPVTTKIDAGFYIGHFGVVIIHPEARIGKNCNVAQGVTIGRIGYGNHIGSPTIGDCVWIGANSVIVGGIHIGSNVLIAPGAFVNFDVPSNSLVIGNPGTIKPKINPVKGYINNTID